MFDMHEFLQSEFIKDHSGEMLILALVCLILMTLLIALPQLLRANLRKTEMSHLERIKSIEQGIAAYPEDERSRLAGRTAVIVPSIAIIAAATVTSFLVVYRTTDNLFAVSLSIWVVAGVVSLAAITGGVALIGRLAQIEGGEKEDEEEDVSEEAFR